MNFDPSSYYQTPERFFPLPGELYNTDPNKYMITSWGRIYNKETGEFVPRQLTRDRNIYIHTALKDINNQEVHVVMHQVVANCFIPIKPIETEETGIIVPNHIDGVKWHNEPYNLEWTTLSENTIHADAHNLISRPHGEDNGSAKLSDEQYHQICKYIQDGYLAHQINEMMNVGFDITNIAQKIRNGSALTVISSQYDFSNIPRNNYRNFTDEQVHQICQYLQDKPLYTSADILECLGYDKDECSASEWKKMRNNISTIRRRVSRTDISQQYNF